MIVTTVTAYGRLYIGCGNEQGELPKILGDVNAYKNLFLQIVTRFLKLSVDVYIGGKMHCVNKRSLDKHLAVIKAIYDKNNIQSFAYDKFIDVNKDAIRKNNLSNNPKLLSSTLSAESRDILTHRFLEGMCIKSPTRLKKLVLKGARIDKEIFFYKGTNEYRTFTQFEIEKAIIDEASKKVDEGYFKYTPLAYFVDADNKELARFFYAIQNRDCSKDSRVQFAFMKNAAAMKTHKLHTGVSSKVESKSVIPVISSFGKEEFKLL